MISLPATSSNRRNMEHISLKRSNYLSKRNLAMLTIAVVISLNEQFPKKIFFCKSESSFELSSKVSEV
jgi:hypothetical protein